MRRIGIAAGALCAAALVGGPAFAQLEANIQGLTDPNVGGYVDPLQGALVSSLNSAVFKTGYVPPTGLTLTLGIYAMAVGFDDGDRSYVPMDPEGFTSLEPTRVPTIIGDPGGGIIAGEDGLAQGYPGGFDLEMFEVAVPQLTIGSVAGTRALVRYIAFELGDTEMGDFSYIGAGLQHSITQWIPSLPVDLAAGAFMQRFEIGSGLFDSTVWLANVTASRRYGVLAPYVGIGYETISSSITIDEDELDESLDVTLDRDSSAHLTAGLMLRLAGIGAFIEYNAAFTSGVALGVEFGQ